MASDTVSRLSLTMGRYPIRATCCFACKGQEAYVSQNLVSFLNITFFSQTNHSKRTVTNRPSYYESKLQSITTPMSGTQLEGKKYKLGNFYWKLLILPRFLAKNLFYTTPIASSGKMSTNLGLSLLQKLAAVLFVDKINQLSNLRSVLKSYYPDCKVYGQNYFNQHLNKCSVSNKNNLSNLRDTMVQQPITHKKFCLCNSHRLIPRTI